jgi:hypothetical protein
VFAEFETNLWRERQLEGVSPEETKDEANIKLWGAVAASRRVGPHRPNRISYWSICLWHSAVSAPRLWGNRYSRFQSSHSRLCGRSR